MEKYYYTKLVTPEPFKDYMMVTLSKDLFKKLNFNIKVYDKVEDLEDDNVEITSVNVLLSSEQDEIATAINSYDDTTNSFAVRYKIEVGTMTPAAGFGNTLASKMAASNIFRGKHKTKILYNGVEKEITSHIVDKHNILILNMLTGSLTDVYRSVLALTPDELFSQEEIDELKRRLELYLGV